MPFTTETQAAIDAATEAKKAAQDALDNRRTTQAALESATTAANAASIAYVHASNKALETATDAQTAVMQELGL